jgi:hypothetical protein
MSRLFVVNCTAQNRQVYYRLDFAVDGNGNRMDARILPPKYLEIPAGAQVQFGGDLFPGQADQLIQQLEFSAGAVAMDQIRTAKANGVVKLIWSLDKPIPRAICDDVKAHNMGRLADLGVERRKNLAIVSDYGLRELANELGGNQSAGLEMEFESVGQSDPDMTAPKLEEGLRINSTGKRGRSRKS